MIKNTIFARNKDGKKALVCNLTFPSLELVEMAGSAGFDAIFIDGEHGPFGLPEVESVTRLAHALGMSVIARTPNTQADTLTQWLDRGIQGVMAPHVETAEQTRELVDACYYPPLGHRSWGTGRGNLFNDETLLEEAGGRRAFMSQVNDDLWIYAQIESRLGLENIQAILQVEGLHAIAFGSFDLAISLGFAGEGAGHPEIDRVQADIVSEARSAGKGVFSDRIIIFGLQSLLAGEMRRFVASNRDAAFE